MASACLVPIVVVVVFEVIHVEQEQSDRLAVARALLPEQGKRLVAPRSRAFSLSGSRLARDDDASGTRQCDLARDAGKTIMVNLAAANAPSSAFFDLLKHGAAECRDTVPVGVFVIAAGIDIVAVVGGFATHDEPQ